MENCVFCKIVSNEFDSYKLYEDDNFIVILDKFPTTSGHTLIITKNHYDDFYDLDEYVASELLVLAQKVARAIKETTGCTGLNILQNNGKDAGQVVFHYHLHLIPRYENDGVSFNLSSNDLTDADAKNLMEQIINQLEA